MYRIKSVLYYLLHERSKRASFSVIYTLMLLAGIPAFLNLPTLLIREIGQPMIVIFACFIFFGSAVALAGLFVNYAWVERVGVILLITALIMYSVMLLMLTTVTIAIFVVAALIICLGQRFVDIRIEGSSG